MKKIFSGYLKGVKGYKKNIVLIYFSFFIFYALITILSLVGYFLNKISSYKSLGIIILFSLIGVIVIYILLGIFHFILNVIDDNNPAAVDIFLKYDTLISYLSLLIIQVLSVYIIFRFIVSIGLISELAYHLIIPSIIILILCFSFSPLVFSEKKMDILNGVLKVIDIVFDNFLASFLFYLCLLMINVILLVPFIVISLYSVLIAKLIIITVVVLFNIPLSLMIWIAYYRELNPLKKDKRKHIIVNKNLGNKYYYENEINDIYNNIPIYGNKESKNKDL